MSNFFAFVFGGGRPLSLAEKIEGLGRRNGKIDERNGAGEQKKQIKKLRMCDMSGSGEGIESEGEDRGDDGINDLCQRFLSTRHFEGENSQINTLQSVCFCR